MKRCPICHDSGNYRKPFEDRIINCECCNQINHNHTIEEEFVVEQIEKINQEITDMVSELEKIIDHFGSSISEFQSVIDASFTELIDDNPIPINDIERYRSLKRECYHDALSWLIEDEYE